MAALLLLAAVAGLAQLGRSREAERPILGLVTGLPIIWGEGGIGDVLSGASKPAPAFQALDRRFRVQPLDAIDDATLSEHRLLLLAQPRALAPGELVALDAWLRGGGRALILTDPLLVWHSELGLGDPRRAPAIGLLDPLLTHWGLALDPPADGAASITDQVLADGERLRTAGRGSLVAEKPGCTVSEQSLVARCKLGDGEAIIVADADLLDAELWRGADNMEAIQAWLKVLAR